VSVHFFHGDKGGVGKSFVAQSFVDWLATRGIAPLVIDSDLRNPDLARMFPDAAVSVDLRQHEGWLELLSLLHESDREQVVVSLPAGIGAEMTAELPAFFGGLRELGREATLLWVRAPRQYRAAKLPAADRLSDRGPGDDRRRRQTLGQR
jgi:hypothetical protein